MKVVELATRIQRKIGAVSIKGHKGKEIPLGEIFEGPLEIDLSLRGIPTDGVISLEFNRNMGTGTAELWAEMDLEIETVLQELGTVEWSGDQGTVQLIALPIRSDDRVFYRK